jgi:hypothetical protein
LLTHICVKSFKNDLSCTFLHLDFFASSRVYKSFSFLLQTSAISKQTYNFFAPILSLFLCFSWVCHFFTFKFETLLLPKCTTIFRDPHLAPYLEYFSNVYCGWITQPFHFVFTTIGPTVRFMLLCHFLKSFFFSQYLNT